MWYAAHAVMLIRLKSGDQTEFTVWENILLIEAATPDEAHDKAKSRALEDEWNLDDTFTWDDKPAEFKFLGLRKLNQCFSFDGQQSQQPGDGDEITFNQIRFANREQLELYVAGEEAQLTIDDERPCEPEGDN